MIKFKEIVDLISGHSPWQSHAKMVTDRIALDEASHPPYRRVLDELDKFESQLKLYRQSGGATMVDRRGR